MPDIRCGGGGGAEWLECVAGALVGGAGGLADLPKVPPGVPAEVVLVGGGGGPGLPAGGLLGGGGGGACALLGGGGGELREVEEGQMRVVEVGPHGHVGVYCLAKEGRRKGIM